MVNGAAGRTMVVTTKVSGMATYALPASCGCGADASAVGCRVAGLATISGVDLANADERRGCGRVTAHTVDCFGGREGIYRN